MENGPATIGYLRSRGLRLEVHCHSCGRMQYRDFEKLADNVVVPDIAKLYRLKCHYCGSRPVSTRPGHPCGYGGWPKSRY